MSKCAAYVDTESPMSGCNCNNCNQARGQMSKYFCLECNQHSDYPHVHEKDTAASPPPFKLDLSHIPGFFVQALSTPFMLGAAKYGRGSWRSGVTTREQAEERCNRRLGSLLNHLTAYMDGEFYDAEGPAHLSAVAWNALYILYLKVTFGGWFPFHKEKLTQTLSQYEAKKGGK